jgi:hypothetical protein
MQSDQTIRKKKMPKFSKNSPKSLQVKKGQNIYNKAQFENPKHLHQTTFKTLKYLSTTAYLGKNVINLLKQKVPQKVTIIFSKNHYVPPKVTQLAKIALILTCSVLAFLTKKFLKVWAVFSAFFFSASSCYKCYKTF